MVRHEQRCHLGLIHAYANSIAGNAWLADFEQGSSDLIAVAYAHFAVGQAFDSQVLAELPIAGKFSPEVALPVAIRIDLIHHHGAVFAAMACKVPLAIAVDIQAPHGATTWHRLLPDRCVHGISTPCNIPGKTDVNR
jgi:hypothetical protein